MNKFLTLVSATLLTTSLIVSNASAFQAAPPSSEKAKEMMKKNAEKGNSAEAKANAAAKKAEGKAKAEAAKAKEIPSTDE